METATEELSAATREIQPKALMMSEGKQPKGKGKVVGDCCRGMWTSESGCESLVATQGQGS